MRISKKDKIINRKMSPQDEFAAAHVEHFQSFASVLRMSMCIGIKCFLFLVYYT